MRPFVRADVVLIRATQRVVVTGRIEQGGTTHAFSSETDVTAAEPSAELLSAAHGDVEVDLIGSVQRDGAMCVTVTVQRGDGGDSDDEDADELQAWTTVVPTDCSAEFSVTIGGGAVAAAHGTIVNRRVAG